MSRDPSSVRPDAAEPGAHRRLDALVSRARAVLAWETVWPLLWWPVGVLLLFLAVSWLGLWGELSVPFRQAGVALFAAALLGSSWPLLRGWHRASRAAALGRIDRDTGTGHRPALAIADGLALGEADAGSRALWALHRGRALAQLSRLRVAPPRPGMARRDPWAVRGAALLLAAGAAVVAGPEIGSRLGTAFQWRGDAPGAPRFRIDGWIDPPLYTRLPPLMIDFAGGGSRSLRAPVGSTVVIRTAGQGEAAITAGEGLAPQGEETVRDGLRERRFRLAASSELAVSTGLAARAVLAGGSRLLVEAIPDRAPEISLSAPPEVNARGTFNLIYKARDDYGLVSAEGRIERADAASSGRRSLVAPPTVGLQLPSDHRTGDETRTTADLTEHPWAGARVRLTLAARDEADQEGRSAPVEFTLPQRPFTKPLAKALVEQRRAIILDPDHRRPVQLALDSLLIAPERFTPEWGVFLGLRTAADRYRAARTDEELTVVADWLWAMALQIEEGDLSEAERELRAAQERLREAMDRGADEKEIAKLAEELRRAMDRFLREFAEQMRRDPQGADRSPTGQERVITQNDLNRMLQDMQDALKRGDMAEAQRLMDQLKSILENLKTAGPGGRMSDPMAREMNRQMEELDSIIRDQQALRDETFRKGSNGERNAQPPGQQGRPQQGQRGERGQRGQQPGPQGESGESEQERAENGQEGGGSPGLGGRQQALRERLEQLQRRMRGMGMQGEQGFGDAEGAMRDAEGQLGRGRNGQAVDSQGRALEGLQRGMQGLAQQMQGMPGENDGQDQGGEPGGPGNPQGRASNDPRNDDPLGRPTRSRDMSDGRVRIPGADESAVARARRILDELRRKLGDPTRPREELDYFERLLRRN